MTRLESKSRKIFLNVLFIPLFWSLSYVVPKKRGLIAFGSYYGHKFIGNPKYFYLYLLHKKKSHFKPIWITRHKIIYSTLKKEAKPVAYLYSMRGIWQILRAQYLLIGEAAQDITGRTFLLGKFNIIESWHTTPLKAPSIPAKSNRTLYQKISIFFLYRELALYKFVLSCSESASEHLRSFFINNKIQILGYPRNDVFYHPELIYDNYSAKLGLRRYHKILLYAPTFRDGRADVNPFSAGFLSQLNDYLKQNNYLLLIKDHPISIFGTSLRSYNLSNIQDVTKSCEDIQELLIYADILITDYSGTIFEFCLMNRPIIFYCYDHDEYVKKCRRLRYDYFQEMPGPFARNEDELIPLIENTAYWFNETAYRKKYDHFRDKFNKFQDGKSCERLHEYLKAGNF